MSSAEQRVRTVQVPGAVLGVHRPAAGVAAAGREPGLFVHGLGGSAADREALMDRLSGQLAVPGAAALLRGLSAGGRDAEAATADLLRLLHGGPDGLSPAARARAVAEYRRRLEVPHTMRAPAGSARGIVSAYTERGGQALWRQAERVAAPVLLVDGLRDKLVSYRSARRACAAFADARLLVLPESGHVAMTEHPEEVARAVRELIGRRRG